MLIQEYVPTHSGRYEWSTIELDALTIYGNPVVLSDDQLSRLAAGGEVRYADSWDALIRLPRAPRQAPTTQPIPAFTCPRCGGHRSTTLAGQCDDCGE